MLLQNRPIALSFIAAAWFYQGLQALIGMIGAFLPAIHAARTPLAVALRGR